MSLRERLQARQLPTAKVSLAGATEGAEPAVLELRALPPDEWEALVELHPPSDEQRKQGLPWNVATFRHALLACSVVTAPGEGLSEEDWRQATKLGWVTIGELLYLYDTALELNDRSPQASTGKGSSATDSSPPR